MEVTTLMLRGWQIWQLVDFLILADLQLKYIAISRHCMLAIGFYRRLGLLSACAYNGKEICAYRKVCAYKRAVYGTAHF